MYDHGQPAIAAHALDELALRQNELAGGFGVDQRILALPCSRLDAVSDRTLIQADRRLNELKKV